MNKIEIMSPVGSFETLIAAIQGGAGSIYFGVEKLNMRARSANNFTVAHLPEIVKICNENNVKTYLALNTIIYDTDIQDMQILIDEAKKNNISAIIASDVAVLEYAKVKEVEIHASTQLNISNINAVKFYAKYFDVMVLARELTLEQIKNIFDAIQKEQIKGPSGELIKLEIFAHGALCMAISGKCYLSLHEKNQSANRGACHQTCRHAYIVTNKETGYELEIDNEYIMSPKDLCTIDFLDKIINAGVQILKIEGRARPPEYVKTVTEVYKEAVNGIIDGTYNQQKIDEWKKRLSRVFNRGFWDGYYLGRKMGEWSELYGSQATRKKYYIGDVTNFFGNLNVAEIKIKADKIEVGDEILIIGQTTGVVETEVKEIRKELKPVQIAQKGDIVSIPLPEKVRRSDKLYKLLKYEF